MCVKSCNSETTLPCMPDNCDKKKQNFYAKFVLLTCMTICTV
jgi:hypothetical protein